MQVKTLIPYKGFTLRHEDQGWVVERNAFISHYMGDKDAAKRMVDMLVTQQ